MKSFSSSTSHTHLTTSHSSVSMPTGHGGVSSPLSAVSVDQSLPSSTGGQTHWVQRGTAEAWVLVHVCAFPPCEGVLWSSEGFSVSRGFSEISSSLLQSPEKKTGRQSFDCIEVVPEKHKYGVKEQIMDF